MLAGLDACQSPGDKAAIPVAARKIVVGKSHPSVRRFVVSNLHRRLSGLPRIGLISEDDATYK